MANSKVRTKAVDKTLKTFINESKSVKIHKKSRIYSVGACVADTNARGQLMLILGTMHNFEEYAIVIQKNDGAIF